MENQNEEQNTVNQIYEYAVNLMIHENKNSYEVQMALKERGLDDESAKIIVENLEKEIEDAKKERANKDMLYGALWCIGGIIATASNIGFIFWGAIVFGAIQFFRGLFKIYN